MTSSFGARVMDFYNGITRFRWATPDVALLSPLADPERHDAMSAFCHKFYGDNNRRVFWLGINPSRVRRTSSGVPYTDGFALRNFCEIPNEFAQNRELTSDFFYKFIENFGGAREFYRRHYAGAAFAASILRKDKYCNYYDRDLPAEVIASIPESLARQSDIGHAGVLVVIGSGENAKTLRGINAELKIFNHILVVEHPRYIMQYKSISLDEYIVKFCETAHEAEHLAGF